MAQRRMNSDSYGRVTVGFLYERVKGILTLSPTLLGALAKTLGAPKQRPSMVSNFA